MNPQITPSFSIVCRRASPGGGRLAQPFHLPPDKYAVWKDIVLNFDPRDMF